MAAVSPPKPWERAKGPGLASSITTSSPIAQTTTATPTSMSSSEPPSLPEKPSSLSTVVNRTASNYSPYNNARFGNSAYASSPYNTYGGYGSYSSPYSRFGAMGNGMYSGYGTGYGSMYGGMGGGMYGGMNGGMMGQPGMMGADPNDPNSLTNSFSQSTQATFQMIESLVGAFGGVAQMLESTYMATHSSFFAMVSVAEQFSNLRTTLGSILGIFALARYLRTLFAKLTGRPPPVDATSLTPAAFASFQGFSSSSSPQRTLPNGQPAPSRKPFLFFLAAVLGLPYLMAKLIRSLASSQQQQQNLDPNNPHHHHNQALIGPDGQPIPNPQNPLDPTKLIFCRALYDYPPSTQPTPTLPPPTLDLAVKKGDLVAVLTKLDPAGQASEWWHCRSRDGRVGYLPGVYLEEIKRKPMGSSQSAADADHTGKGNQPLIEEGGRLNTLTSILGGGSGAGTERSDGSATGVAVGGGGGQDGRADSIKVEARRK